jgi:hypothetical protein
VTGVPGLWPAWQGFSFHRGWLQTNIALVVALYRIESRPQRGLTVSAASAIDASAGTTIIVARVTPLLILCRDCTLVHAPSGESFDGFAARDVWVLIQKVPDQSDRALFEWVDPYDQR